MTDLQRIKQANPNWFDSSNKKFFGDQRYYVYRSPITDKLYLIRSTFAWSDMFGGQRRLSFRVNPVNMVTLKIESLIDESFNSLVDAKAYIRNL